MSDTMVSMQRGDLPGIELQPRDWEMLRGLFESRVMTLKHITALYFDGKSEMAKKRVQRMKALKLLRERPRHAPSPSVLFLGTKAFKLLRDHGDLSNYPKIGLSNLEKRVQVSELTLRHELEVMDVKVAMTIATKSTERFRVAEFSTWPLLYKFKACRSNGMLKEVWPDAFIRVHEREDDGGLSEHVFFLEVDRSTENVSIVAEQMHCYVDYYRSGGFAVRFGGKREEFKKFPFRVLVVCKGSQRRDNLAAQLLSNSLVGSQVWLTTHADITKDPLGTIWIRPRSYRQPTATSTDLLDITRIRKECLFGDGDA